MTPTKTSLLLLVPLLAAAGCGDSQQGTAGTPSGGTQINAATGGAPIGGFQAARGGATGGVASQTGGAQSTGGASGIAMGGTSGGGGTGGIVQQTGGTQSGGARSGGTGGVVSRTGGAHTGGRQPIGGTGGLIAAGGTSGGGGTGGMAWQTGGKQSGGTGGGVGTGGIVEQTGGNLPVYAYAATVENTGADCEVAALPDPAQLPKISKLPDPFKKIGGTPMTKRSEWRCRRQEIHEQAEKYIYGEKPSRDVVTGSVTQNKISVHVEAEGKKIDFSADVVLPSTGRGPYPAIINVGAKGGVGGISLGESRILQMGVAVIYYNHNQVGVEGTPEQSRGKPNSGLFYDIYGGNHSAGLLMAWAWGASRLIDVVQDSAGDIIDYRRLGVTGCSRNGKGAFAIGVFDERIALTIPQETSTAGVPAYRIVDVLGKERTDHNYFGLNWLSNNFEPFVFKNNVSNAVNLPIDSHALIAMIAPRGLLVLENPHQAQMGAPAGHTATVAGAEVYKALGVDENISYHSDVSDTNHCSYKNEYTELLTESIAKFLKHESEDPGRIEVGANGSMNRADWIDWQTPALENDTALYGAD